MQVIGSLDTDLSRLVAGSRHPRIEKAAREPERTKPPRTRTRARTHAGDCDNVCGDGKNIGPSIRRLSNYSDYGLCMDAARHVKNQNVLCEPTIFHLM